MSLKGTKRGAGVRGEEAGASKRRRTEPEDALWQLRPVSDLKMSSIYNRSASEAPAELFRKDLISAMKLPDSEPLAPSDYWVITDTWKQDWERGVQVPVNPDSLPAPKVKIVDNPLPPDFQEFKLPRDKYIHLMRDGHYQSDKHVLSTAPARAEAACSYDMDAIDVSWLRLLNAERARAGAQPITEDQFEKVIEELEVRTWDKIQAILKSEEGLGIEYDENVICDVCRSPESEDGNEMVFCDSCNICVHQACYGITVIPDGQWLCRPCGSGVRPTCVLCPNLGGAMKCTPSGHKWAHVSCVLWIPEVSIGCAEKMEPITKISSIPASRWSLVCVLCRERKGACIQCSVKTCKTAYHVTCAFKHGLEMRAIIEDENADDGVKLRSYCQKHSVNSKKEKCAGSGSEEEEVKRKRRKDMTSEEKTQARAARLQEIEAEFDRHVAVKDVSTHLLDVDQDAINYVYNYWKLKRRAGHNRPLLPPKADDSELLTHRQEQADLDKMRMFVQLRQDLERVRNLCYMVSRREKLSRSFFRMREQTFHKQVAVLSADPDISGPDLAAIIEANHGPSIYDRLYSHPNAPDHKNDFDALLARIAPVDSGDEKKKDRNGLVKGGKSANPYKKHYVNGSRRSGSMYSGLSSEESAPELNRARYRARALGSSTDDDAKKSANSPKKKVSPKTKVKRSPKKIERKKKKVPQSKAVVESSSEDESIKSNMKKDRSRSKTLQQMEKEMAATKMSGTDSDDIIQVKSSRNSKFPVDIYSDSSDDMSNKAEPDSKIDKLKTDKTKPVKSKSEKSANESDTQQPLPRTKAAMKEFIPTQPEKKPKEEEEEKISPKKRGRKPSSVKEKKTPVKSNNESEDEAKNKENIKILKQKDNPTDLIVPQRQAAKKASENMRSTTIAKKEEPVVEKQQVSGDDAKSKPKVINKSKGKEVKEAVPAKVGRKKSTKDVEKETIAYVPQRQAAKKAAAHIKSGLGSKVPVVEASDTEKKKDNEKSEPSKMSPKKDESKSNKASDKESSSSSSNSSSSSYSSSSSSEEEQEKPEIKPTVKAREIKPATRQPSLFSPPPSTERTERPRPTVDLPFLVKVSRPLSSTSASSDSESSKGSKRSGSISPYPKRPRRRRKGKSLSSDTSPLKTPDKKLKTSERGSECRVPTPPAQGEEPSRPVDARAAPRTRTRSTTSGGNMSSKLDSRQRKPSKDDASGQHKTPKESTQSGELQTAERKADEEIKLEAKEEPLAEDIVKPERTKAPKIKRRSDSFEDKEKIKAPDLDTSIPRTSPKKGVEVKHKTVTNRRMSVKEAPKEISPREEKSPRPRKSPREELRESATKERRPSRHEPPKEDRLSVSPSKKPADKPVVNMMDTSPIHINEHFADSDKTWPPKAPSPIVHPPPIEKPGGHEKYMTDDKAFDSDSADKSSLRMIAKIQANLNENTMIKSPKTPMDARSVEPIDIESHPMVRNIRKRSNLDSEKKFIAQDVSHVQGVEISKSAKIPSTVNPYPHRSMFSPKDNELFELDMMAVDDGFNHDDMIKPFTSYNEFFFKEDSKEQGVQETLNLVDRLRMQLSTKKVPAENPPQDEPITISEEKERKDPESNVSNSLKEQEPANKSAATEVHQQSPRVETNHLPNASDVPPREHTSDRSNDKMDRGLPLVGPDKWPELPPSRTHSPDMSAGRYNRPYDEMKRGQQLEQSDSMSVSKSEDSQPLSVVDSEQYENNKSNCASPYVGPEKWRESKIATRRSSASSSASERSPPPLPPRLPEVEYPPMPAYTCPVEPALPLNQYSSYPPESPFLLFPAPLPSPGPQLYPPSLPFAPIPPLPKPAFPTLCAAFTSSSQNIALTTAMIAPPTPKPESPPREDIDLTRDDTPSADSYPDPVNAPSTNESSAPVDHDAVNGGGAQDSKSPPKPSRTTPKFGKSPGKSPAGISPKQSDASKGTKRPSNRSNRGQRGRGRSKSRGHNYPPDYVGNSIQSKLVGTVYDFKEEFANDDEVDLKALRERRKSIDVREERKSEQRSPREPSPLVAPVLPGPVDMRTYAGEPAPTAQPPYTHLLAFASGTAEQPLPDIDEEVEKQLQTALMLCKPSTPAPQPPPLQPLQPPVMPQLKVSLSDSRNQLKVKIKGPFLDANYSSAPAVVPQPPAPAEAPTNLRRMRKKELLRQYWTQDMNMEESAPVVQPAPPPLPRAVITIPKAVASMTSMPTREDYRPAEAVDKKKRGLARELRHLDTAEDRPAPPRRARQPAKPGKPPPPPPKLKIKIGSDLVPQLSDEPQFRPPKKRLMAPAPKPSLEDLRRESMKYRRMVMADFEEHEKPKKHKPNKSEKRKKKKDKKAEKLQVVNSESESATKLIIKIKRTKEEEEGASGTASTTAGGLSGPCGAAAAAPEPAVDPFEYDPAAPDPLAIDPPSYAEASSAMRKIRTAKVTPIRLKLARTSEGSGYVMKGTDAPQPADPPVR